MLLTREFNAPGMQGHNAWQQLLAFRREGVFYRGRNGGEDFSCENPIGLHVLQFFHQHAGVDACDAALKVLEPKRSFRQDIDDGHGPFAADDVEDFSQRA